MQQTGPKVSGKFFYVHKVEGKPWVENIFQKLFLDLSNAAAADPVVDGEFGQVCQESTLVPAQLDSTTLNCKEKIQILSTLGL